MGSPLKVMFMTEYHDAISPLNRLNESVIRRASRLLQRKEFGALKEMIYATLKFVY